MKVQYPLTRLGEELLEAVRPYLESKREGWDAYVLSGVFIHFGLTPLI